MQTITDKVLRNGNKPKKSKKPKKNVIYDYGELPTFEVVVKKPLDSAFSRSKKHIKKAKDKKLGFMDRAKAYYAAAFEADQAKYER